MASKEETVSKEEKFLGLKSDLDTDTEDLDVEFEEEEGVEARKEEGVEQDKPKKEEPEDEAPEDSPEKTEAKDDEDELDSYSKRVQKRIDRLTWEREEANRKAQETKQVADRAVEYARALHHQNQQYQSAYGAGEEELVASIKRAAEASVAAAKKDLFNATEAGKTQEAIDANERLIQAQAELIQAGYRDNAIKQRKAQQSAQQWSPGQPFDPQYGPPQHAQPQQPAVPQPTQRDLKWRDENEWFHHPDHPDMTSYAYGLHQKLVTKEGIKPNSDQYYTEIDKAMKAHFPEYFGPSKKPTTVVSSSQRDSGPPRRQVKLSASERELVRRLGIDEKEYAANKLKLEQANA